VIKYKADTRYSDKMTTHDRTMIEALPCEKLSDALEASADYEVIGIDEGQFFPDLVEMTEQWASAGKVVICAALDGDFLRRPFGRVLELVPLAESVTKLSAICQVCFGPASFSKRLGAETALEVIGGADKYIATCRRCHRPEATHANIAKNTNTNKASVLVSTTAEPAVQAKTWTLESPVHTIGMSKGRDL
jgi:thymidine kinase